MSSLRRIMFFEELSMGDQNDEFRIDNGHVSDTFIKGNQGPKDHGSPLVQKIEKGGRSGWLETEVDGQGNVGNTDWVPDKR
ncbi:MAG TPA: hypothetical protein VMO47_00530 [Rhodothermales bacterium]|nr:hypothetical protein [Rhodothermales bacterium]